MRSYLVDELTFPVVLALEKHLTDKGLASPLEGLYWIPVPESELSSMQRAHLEQCGPYVLALELRDDAVRLEWLVRGLNRMRCECLDFAPPELARQMEAWLNTLLDDLMTPCHPQ